MNVTASPMEGYGRGMVAMSRWAAPMLALYVGTRLLMVLPSGLPQPADVMLLLALLLAVRPHHLMSAAGTFPPYAFFVAWVVAVSASWTLLTLDAQYLVHAAFQVFNFLLFSAVLWSRVAAPDRFDRWVRWGVGVAAFIQVVALLAEGRSFRAQGTFNNENQLAYWALCVLGIYTVVRPRPTVRDVPVVLMLLWAELVSTSRAGVVACGLMVLVWAWQLLIRSRQRYLFLALAVFGLPAYLSSSGDGASSDIYTNFVHRFTKDSASEEAAFRNFDRIGKYPEFAVLGAGEGALERFPHSLPIEIHSTPATILFSYGVFGSLVYWLFLGRLAARLSWSGRVALFALVVYSATHNGLRFTYAWFLIALLASQTMKLHQSPVAATAPARFVRPPRRLRGPSAEPEPAPS